MTRRRALDRYQQVDAVEQRPAQTAAVARQIGFAAPAALLLARHIRTGRGWWPPISMKASRIHRRVACSDDRHPPILEWLAQGLQGRTCELRELVEEQDAVVSEHHLPDPSPSRSADQPGRRDRVVGCTERTLSEQLETRRACR